MIEPLVPWLEGQTGFGLLDYTVTDRKVACDVTDSFTSFTFPLTLPDGFEVIRLPSDLWPMPEGEDWKIDHEGNCDYLVPAADASALKICLPPLRAAQQNLADASLQLRSHTSQFVY
jgi:hypothetical protein